jgi:hypothetical protein
MPELVPRTPPLRRTCSGSRFLCKIMNFRQLAFSEVRPYGLFGSCSRARERSRWPEAPRRRRRASPPAPRRSRARACGSGLCELARIPARQSSWKGPIEHSYTVSRSVERPAASPARALRCLPTRPRLHLIGALPGASPAPPLGSIECSEVTRSRGAPSSRLRQRATGYGSFASSTQPKPADNMVPGWSRPGPRTTPG